jgi:hypothetical protein
MPHADAAVVDGDVSPPGVDGGYSGRWVSVSIKSAIIAPGKTDGTNWDGLGDVDPDLAQSVAVALLGPSPAAAVLGAYAAPAVAALDKPDPYGDAQAIAFGVIGKPVALATFDAPISNTFNPIWRLGWSYTNVPIDSDVRIGITLWDSDLVDDDPIDAVELNSQDLKDALAAQQVFDVRVDDQGQHQLLFVGVSVTQQLGPL